MCDDLGLRICLHIYLTERGQDSGYIESVVVEGLEARKKNDIKGSFIMISAFCCSCHPYFVFLVLYL